MTDMDLLKLAAKAAGFDYITTGDEEIMYAWEGREPTKWNPLADDGDALRLAVKLRIEYIFVSDRQSIQCQFAQHTEMGDWETFLCDEPIGEDVCASMRRAIVRAAAEIGKRGS
jgi:hypothetical protein